MTSKLLHPTHIVSKLLRQSLRRNRVKSFRTDLSVIEEKKKRVIRGEKVSSFLLFIAQSLKEVLLKQERCNFHDTRGF
jgi:hypothetical protein